MKKMPVFLILIFILIGCNKSPSGTTNEGPNTAAAITPIRGPLLARVNDWAIGLDDFKNYLNRLKPLVGNQVDVDSDKFKKDFLSDLVRTQILAQVAVERGYDKDEDLVRALRDTKNSLLYAKMRTELERKIDVSSTEVSSFYERNKQFLVKPKKIKIREIAVRTEYQAKEIYVKILQNEDFSSLARQFSQLPTNEKGGDLGFVSAESKTIFPKLWDVAMNLGRNEVSNIFKGEDGNYYIIKVDEIEGGQVPQLSEIEKELKEALKQDKIEVEINKLIDKFKEKARIEKNEDLIK